MTRKQEVCIPVCTQISGLTSGILNDKESSISAILNPGTGTRWNSGVKEMKVQTKEDMEKEREDFEFI